MKPIVILTLLYLTLTGCTATHLAAKDTAKSKINVLDRMTLSYPLKNGIPFGGISDLAYNPKSGDLYMIGDRGYLYHFKAELQESIQKLDYRNAYRLTNRHGKVVRMDSEGLDHNQKNELIISFERRSQISKITPQGKLYLNYSLPKKLQNRSVFKTSNSMFEGLTYHPQHGILTAAEYPINGQKNTHQTIYGLKGQTWHFNAEAYPNSAVTALEVMEDNNLLVLERAYNGLTQPLYITLKKLYLDRCNAQQQCASEVLITFDSFQGWSMGNFEGLTQVAPNRYLMVSDNNEHPMIATSLVYFEVTP
ncbi:MAG TPA: esterase-like activity of phytase family protein [Campylobacterales bacterium]|nr:esterase-like activity of phytase family protein [Campylobacterales bacterium]